MKFEFYCLANNISGYGHLHRCITLGNRFRKEKWKSNFNILGNNQSTSIIKNLKFKGKSFLSFRNLKKETISKKIKYLNSSTAILDISHESIISNKLQFTEWFVFIKKNFSKIIVIDTVGSLSIGHFINKLNLNVDILIIPYISNLPFPQNSDIKLFGPKYFIFSEFYSKLKKRKINSIAKNILITCGGSDPNNITIAIINSLNQIEKPLNIRVIIGPFYKKKLLNNAKKIKKNTIHKMTYYQSPSNLCNHMLWSDLTISTSGLSKYELALTGTPSLLISIDKMHNKMNASFNKLESSINLGIFMKKNDYAKKIKKVLNDYSIRKKLSISGQTVLDALGTNRIINEIKKL